MSNPESRDDQIDPHAVAAQSAALARHLQSSGVAFLPAARADRIAELAKRFLVPEMVDPDAASPTSSPVTAAPVTAAPVTAAPVTAAPASAQPAPTLPTTGQPPKKRPPVLLDAVEVPYAGEPLAAAARTEQLQILSQQVAGCTRCEKLAACRKNTVFGEGSVMPRVAFFGEGPGADEDRTGRPFVGKAGQLLTKMIEACSFERDDVYILNTVKCRPPGNRNPEPDEISNCREYFENQFQILRPEYIICLGAIASQTLLNSKLSVGRLRGKFHRYFDSKVLVTYHPAYLLRNPAAKKAAWQDLQLMLRDAGIIDS